jgi:hypothetical protein
MVVVGVAGVIASQTGLMPDVVSFVQNQSFLKSLAFWKDQPSDRQTPIPQDQNPDRNKPASTQPESAPNTAERDADTSLAQAAPLQSDPPQDSAEPVVAKPSPLAPPATAAQETSRELPERRSREVLKIPVAPHIQDVWVSTNPPGAKVVLDDDLSQACRTPCIVHAPTGIHNLTISQAGYENVNKEIRVGDTAQDVPPITLLKPSGTLMLTTTPPGASVRVDGKLIQQLTPAALALPPGNYSITVEKGGQSRTQRVEVQQGVGYLSIPLNP